MDDWRGDPDCPDCGHPLRALKPPPEVVALFGDAPELFHCRECVVTVDRFGEAVECPKLFHRDDGGELRVAPDTTQWLLADEAGPD